MANSPVDENFQRYYVGHLKSGSTDSASDITRLPGELYVAIPVLFGAYLLSNDPDIKGWANDSIRAIAIGAPAGLALQYITGGGRPEEGGSEWSPFRDDNGLSGHAFIGAVPFIVAAKRTDSPCVTALLYTASALPALSRINDGKHFLSQASLGWFLGYLSVNAVHKEDSAFAVLPYGDLGLMVSFQF